MKLGPGGTPKLLVSIYLVKSSISRSAYFEAALSKEWMERNSGRMELKDCSYEALEVAVNFMSGVYILPEN